GLTIRDGGIGVLLAVPTIAPANDPAPFLRTEIRDCLITENKYNTWRNLKNGYVWGGTGIKVISYADAPTQYVIERNTIRYHADSSPGPEPNPSSFAIHIGLNVSISPFGAVDSTLIRGNELYDQETGIGIYGNAPGTWVRPRIMSNLLADHEQHIYALNGA